MTFWNLLVVLCFAVLYVGLAMVFVELRRLRDEIKIHQSGTLFPDPAEMASPSQGEGEKVEALRQDLTGGQERILRFLAALPNQVRVDLDGMSSQVMSELDAVQRQLQYLEQVVIERSQGGGGGRAKSGGGDAYQEAKMLLADGVDEDQVINETGLTVEEVSLLKRLSQVRGQ